MEDEKKKFASVSQIYYLSCTLRFRSAASWIKFTLFYVIHWIKWLPRPPRDSTGARLCDLIVSLVLKNKSAHGHDALWRMDAPWPPCHPLLAQLSARTLIWKERKSTWMVWQSPVVPPCFYVFSKCLLPSICKAVSCYIEATQQLLGKVWQG